MLLRYAIWSVRTKATAILRVRTESAVIQAVRTEATAIWSVGTKVATIRSIKTGADAIRSVKIQAAIIIKVIALCIRFSCSLFVHFIPIPRMVCIFNRYIIFVTQKNMKSSNSLRIKTVDFYRKSSTVSYFRRSDCRSTDPSILLRLFDVHVHLDSLCACTTTLNKRITHQIIVAPNQIE